MPLKMSGEAGTRWEATFKGGNSLKKLLIIGLALALIGVFIAPLAAFATDGTTDITGNVTSGYTFNTPPTIPLGTMSTGTNTGNSSGNITGNNADGYTVSAVDAKGSNTGYMVSTPSGHVLANKFKIGSSAGSVDTADVSRTLYTGSGPVSNVAVPLYISQTITATDVAASGYTITITYTVTANP